MYQNPFKMCCDLQQMTFLIFSSKLPCLKINLKPPNSDFASALATFFYIFPINQVWQSFKISRSYKNMAKSKYSHSSSFLFSKGRFSP